MLFNSGEFRLLLETPEGLKVADGGLGLGVDVISKRGEGFSFGIVEKTALLEEKREIILAANLLGWALAFEGEEEVTYFFQVEMEWSEEHTLSRTSLQISPEPALAMGRTLISLASSTVLTLVALKRASRATLQ